MLRVLPCVLKSSSAWRAAEAPAQRAARATLASAASPQAPAPQERAAPPPAAAEAAQPAPVSREILDLKMAVERAENEKHVLERILVERDRSEGAMEKGWRRVEERLEPMQRDIASLKQGMAAVERDVATLKQDIAIIKPAIAGVGLAKRLFGFGPRRNGHGGAA